MPNDIEKAIRKFMADNFLYRDGAEFLSEFDSFLENGLIDSVGVLELVMFLESTFSIRVVDEEVLPENLDSIGQIVAYIRRKLASKDQVFSHAS